METAKIYPKHDLEMPWTNTPDNNNNIYGISPAQAPSERVIQAGSGPNRAYVCVCVSISCQASAIRLRSLLVAVLISKT